MVGTSSTEYRATELVLILPDQLLYPSVYYTIALFLDLLHSPSLFGDYLLSPPTVFDGYKVCRSWFTEVTLLL